MTGLVEIIYMILYEGENVRGSVAREGKYTRPARCHVTYHVHVTELKETAQYCPSAPPPTNIFYPLLGVHGLEFSGAAQGLAFG